MKAILFSLGIMILGWGFRPALVQAQTIPALEIITEATYTYAQEMTFSIQASAPDRIPINGVTLTFTAPELPSLYTVELPIAPGREIATTYTIHYEDYPLHPFSTLTYTWQIAFEDGTVETLPPKSIDYVDNRLDWQSLEAPGLVVYWTDTITAADAGVALEAAATAQSRLETALPQPITDHLRIVIFPSTADMRSTLQSAGWEPEDGFSPVELPVIMITAVNPRTATLDIQRRIPEEIIRHRLYRLAGSHHAALPGWLPAGLPVLVESHQQSRYHSEDLSVNGSDICAPAANISPEAAQALIQYLQQTYGMPALRQFISVLSTGIPCDQAILQQYDLTATELTRLWQTTAQSPATWPQIILENGWWLTLFAGSLLALAILFMPRINRSVSQ